jgi:hypothetical protein
MFSFHAMLPLADDILASMTFHLRTSRPQSNWYVVNVCIAGLILGVTCV